MSGVVLSIRERFRRAGRRVLQQPSDPLAHQVRIRIAAMLPGAEPLQGALADMLCHCQPDHGRLQELLDKVEAAQRLPAHVTDAFLAQAASGDRLPRVNSLATRWCVLAVPSLDVPARSQLCSVDDSRALVARVLPSLLAGDAAAESDFLEHCQGARDALAFMLARRRLHRAGRDLSPRWQDVADTLHYEAAP